MATPPFRVPPRVNLVRINAKTGKLARPDDETVILEAFKLGTEPTRNSKQMVVRRRQRQQWRETASGYKY